MTAAAPVPRTRSTKSTARRVENIRGLIAELTACEMLADEICFFLKMSLSGGRKYIRDLRESGVMEVVRQIDGNAAHNSQAVYRTTQDQDRVRAFLAAIEQPAPKVAPPRNRQSRVQGMAGNGRHFHILADDVHYSVRVSRGPAARDPLVAALFGAAPAQGVAA